MQPTTSVDPPACDKCRSLYKEVTPRQVAVIDRLARGDNFNEAASALGISRKTLEKHVQAAKIRLTARTLAQLVAAAIKGGIITV